ncbi:hypothetical protein [Salinicoccus luteus]|uniref:hypothetical protein n=1 Tax=Salinicoccus luteus TaxID=367840 RepID=UPI0004E2018B|nr:hypothetical protein [Salinicoccus luteus]
MIAYHEVNEYLDNVELPQSIEEIFTVEHELDGREKEFLEVAKRFLRENIDFESYRFKQVHCIGTCKINLTRTALYFLLEDEIISVHKSILKDFNEEADWTITQFRIDEIKNMDFDHDDSDSSRYETGVLFLKILNERGAVRNRTLRNLNPNHFQCFRDFYTNMQQNKMV